MAEILDIIDPKNSDMQEVLESVRSNFATINKTGLRSGAYLLADVILDTTEPVTSTTYKTLGGLSGSINTSGGIVLLEFSAAVDVTNLIASFALFIDGEEKAWAIHFDSGQLIKTASISRWVQLNAGNHKWEIKCKVSGGTATIGPNTRGINTTLSIIEFLRG